MKFVFKLYKEDIKNIIKNYAAFIIISALCIIPALYAWFNIRILRSPYSKDVISQIRIGVVNEDYGGEFNYEKINLGNKIIDKLKENDDVNWRFVSKEEGEDELREEKIYGLIIVPEDFTSNMTSFITNSIKRADIIYKVNEKMDCADNMVKVKKIINDILIDNVKSILASTSKDIGIKLDDFKPKISNIYNILLEVQSNLSDLSYTVNSVYDGVTQIKDINRDLNKDIPLIQQTLSDSINLSKSIGEFISLSQKGLEDLAPLIKEDIRIESEMSRDISDYVSILTISIRNNDGGSLKMIRNLSNKINSLDEINTSLLKLLNALNRFNPKLNDEIKSIENIDRGITGLNTTLETAKEYISSEEYPDISIINNIKAFSERISLISESLYNKYDTDTLVRMKQIFDEAYRESVDVYTILNEAENNLPGISNKFSITYEEMDKDEFDVNLVKENILKAQSILENLINKVFNIDNDEKLNELINLLRNDIEEKEEFLSHPINLIKNEIFPIEDYRSSIVPFHTTISLWSGILFLVLILSFNADKTEKLKDEVIKIYFSRLLFFLTLTIIQSVILSCGIIYIFNIYCLKPVLFVVISMLTSILFTCIVYTLCFIFDNAGKVLSIVLLLLQIEYERSSVAIDFNSSIIQNIKVFLPSTYTISLMKESIAGIEEYIIIKDLTAIFVFIVSSIMMAVFFKRPFEKFISKFKESRLD